MIAREDAFQLQIALSLIIFSVNHLTRSCLPNVLSFELLVLEWWNYQYRDSPKSCIIGECLKQKSFYHLRENN
jgi:hypothetical protein